MGALFLPLLLSGCLVMTRKLPIPKAPLITQTATPEDLVAGLNRRWEALDTLTATVEIQASVMKTKEGVAKGINLRGHILMRKPEMLRVVGTLLGIKAIDMASDGKELTVSVPIKGKAFKGPSSLKKKSANALENLRPKFFFDAMVVRGLDPDDLYSVVSDSETIEDKARKNLYKVPEYVLSISRRKGESRQLTPVRVVTFHRDDLLPYQQDLYDSDGNLETQVTYANYRDFESGKYPSTIVIERPLEEYKVILNVEDVKENQTLTDDQFVVKVPEGTETQELE
jgi:outer membrane lipoprotein-sorting protein